MKKIILLVAILLTLTGCKQKENNVITVLTSSGYEPYEMINTDGELIGFDIDLMNALAAEAGLKVEFLDVQFDGIVAALQTGTHEIAIAGITPTTERDLVIDFSSVYYNSEQGLENYLLSEDSYTSLADLEGKVLGAQLGTIQAELLFELSETYNFTVELRQSNAQIVEEIKLGNIDAMVVEKLISDSILAVNETLTSTVLNEDTNQLYGNAIAFSEGSEYKAIFDAALATLIENGTVEELINKWFN